MSERARQVIGTALAAGLNRVVVGSSRHADDILLLERVGLEDLDVDSIRRQFEVNSIGPLRVTRAGDDVYFVNGAPTDWVHLAVTGLLDDEPDMVVSGVNDGANLGDDVLYSGTVAGAMEGLAVGIPGIALSSPGMI